MKKTTSLFLVILLILSLCACGNDKTDNDTSKADNNSQTVSSDPSDQSSVSDQSSIFDTSSPSNDPAEIFEWANVDGGLEITKYKGTSDKVVVPEIIDNKKVVSLGNAFSGNIAIKQMVVPQYVEKFNFSGCDNLERLEFLGDTFDANYDESMPNRALRQLPDYVKNLSFPNASKIHFGIFYGLTNGVEKLELPIAQEIKFFDKIPTQELTIRKDIMYFSSGPQYELTTESSEWNFQLSPQNSANTFCSFFGVDSITVNGTVYDGINLDN